MKGYNPKKRDRKFHHPITAFVHDVRMVDNFGLRSSETSSSTNFSITLEETLSIFEDKKVSSVRLDSGFYSHEIMGRLEEKEDYQKTTKFVCFSMGCLLL